MVTRGRPRRQVAESSQPHLRTRRLPGSTSTTLPAGRVARHDRPPVVATGAEVDARRDRLPAPKPVGLGQQLERLVGPERAPGPIFSLARSASSFSGGLASQRPRVPGSRRRRGRRAGRHPLGAHPVVAEPSFLARLDQPRSARHPQMLGDRRARDAELVGEAADGLLAPVTSSSRRRRRLGSARTPMRSRTEYVSSD